MSDSVDFVGVQLNKNNTSEKNNNKSGINRTTLSAVIGTVVEHYDLIIYAHMLHITAPLFLPSSDPHTASINAFASFALGYLFRPLGGLILGHYTDRLGRKKILAFSIALMSAPTFIIGCLPSYEVIGIWAGIILCVCRAVQSFSTGGETPTAAVILVENSNLKKINLYSSLMNISIYTAGIIGGMVGFLCTQSFIPQWGWRVAFWFGAVMALFGFYIRLKAAETSDFIKIQQNQQVLKIPIIESLKKDKLSLFCTFGFAATVITGNTFIAAYIPSLLKNNFMFSTSQILFITTVYMTIMVFGLIVSALIADIVGSKKMMLVGSGLLTILLPCTLNVAQQENLSLFLIFQTMVCLSFTAVISPLNAVVKFMFPINRRVSGVATSFGIGASIFGGFTPLICQSLSKIGVWATSTYMACCSLFTATCVCLSPTMKN